METISHRIERVIQFYNLNINSFTKKIGYSNNTVIGKIINDRGRKPSFDTLTAILSSCHEIDANWLINGTGNMIREDCNEGIPLYSSSVFTDNKFDNSIGNIFIPQYKDSDISIIKYGNTMEPLILKDSIMICKRASIKNLIYGEVYFIRTTDNAFARRLQPGNELKCVADNKLYKDFDIKIEDIVEIYMVNGVVNPLSA